MVQNSDELFDHPEISAVADIGWPDCFNSGVFVFVPSVETYRKLSSQDLTSLYCFIEKLVEFAVSNGSYDGGDQGLLNAFFNNWRDLPAAHRLSFIYNMTAGAFYSYPAAYKRYVMEVLDESDGQQLIQQMPTSIW